jgi:hypothetical protein
MTVSGRWCPESDTKSFAFPTVAPHLARDGLLRVRRVKPACCRGCKSPTRKGSSESILTSSLAGDIARCLSKRKPVSPYAAVKATTSPPWRSSRTNLPGPDRLHAPRWWASTSLLGSQRNYSLDLALALQADRQVDISVINPRRARRFAESLGERSKTDPVDARVLCEYAARMPWVRWQPAQPNCSTLAGFDPCHCGP